MTNDIYYKYFGDAINNVNHLLSRQKTMIIILGWASTTTNAHYSSDFTASQYPRLSWSDQPWRWCSSRRYQLSISIPLFNIWINLINLDEEEDEDVPDRETLKRHTTQLLNSRLKTKQPHKRKSKTRSKEDDDDSS